MQTVICTIVAKNYLAAARTLMHSIQEFHDNLHLVVLLVDTIDGHFDPNDEPFDVILGTELENIPRFEHFCVKYDILELSTAVKPFLLEKLFNKYNADSIIYFDPDIVVYSRLDELLQLLEQYTAILTPHILQPLNDDRSPGELDFLRVGAYNLGFFAISRKGDWHSLLRWWQARLYNYCTREVAQGLFVDQHWADLMPSFFEGIYILRDPGYNVAYWNFKNRNLQINEQGEYTVNGRPLVFFHFSGFAVADVEVVSKHQDRFTLSDLNESYRQCFKDYKAKLLQNGYQETQHYPYTYWAFKDDVVISVVLRACLRKHDRTGERWPTPLDIASPGNFRQWAVTPQDTSLLSPYAMKLYEMRHDLQIAFPDPQGKHQELYANWFVQQKNSLSMFHPVYIAPVEEALQQHSQKVMRSVDVPPRSLGQRVARTLQFYRYYPTVIKPHLPLNVMDVRSDNYTGPGGVYGAVRKILKHLRLLQFVRRLVGLRLILSARYFFSYPATDIPGLPVLAATLPPQHSRGVNVIGYVYSETGVGQIARNLLQCLDTVNFPVAVHPIETYDTSRKNDRIADQFEKGTPHIVNVFNVNADMTLPVKATLNPAIYQDHYNIGYWAWETANFPEEWKGNFSVYNEIWTFSEFVREAIATHTDLPVVKMPVSINVDLPSDSSRASLGLPETCFLVLFVFDALSIIQRKNPLAVIRAFREAFSADEYNNGVRLVLKANNLGRFPEEAIQIQNELQTVNGILLNSYFSRLKTNALINACDVYISLHRTEGFGLTIAEAMYLGKPVIATNYSGNTDFMNSENSFPVPYKLVALDQDHPPYTAGSQWADPDWMYAAHVLRRLYVDQGERQQIGKSASDYMRQHHNLETTGRRIASRIDYIISRLERGLSIT